MGSLKTVLVIPAALPSARWFFLPRNLTATLGFHEWNSRQRPKKADAGGGLVEMGLMVLKKLGGVLTLLPQALFSEPPRLL